MLKKTARRMKKGSAATAAQETSGGRGCTFGGHCGKNEETANYQDLLIHALKGTGVVAERLRMSSDCSGMAPS